MEVTCVMWKSAILILLYSTNVLAQLQQQQHILTSGPEAAYIPVQRVERSQSHVSAVAGLQGGLQQGQLVLPNARSGDTYVSQPSYQSLFPSLSESFNFGRERPGFPLLKAVYNAVKNLGLFGLGVLQLTDQDRHNSLRQAADNINEVVDAVNNYANRFLRFVDVVQNQLSQLPLIGLLVRLIAKVISVVTYIPRNLLSSTRSFVKNVVDNRMQPTYAVAGIPYSYA